MSFVADIEAVLPIAIDLLNAESVLSLVILEPTPILIQSLSAVAVPNTVIELEPVAVFCKYELGIELI